MVRMAFIILLGGLLAGPGCARPNPVTIQLRKDKQQLQDRIERLGQQHQADRARIAALEQQVQTVPTLPQSRLDRMFTVHAIQLGRATGGADLDPERGGDEALKVYLTPQDQAGDPLKATGQVTVEAFDLNLPHDNRIARWQFTPEQLKDAWRGLGPLQAFVLLCPLPDAPKHPQVTLKVTFRDELTGRTYTAIKDVRVSLPQPATQAGGQP